MTAYEAILQLMNASSIIFIVFGIGVGFWGLIESLRVLITVGFRGRGLPRISITLFLSTLLLFLAFLLSLMVLFGDTKFTGLAYFFISLAIMFNAFTLKNLRKAVYNLLYE